MAATITCPYCFADVERGAIDFRCVGGTGRGPGCAPRRDEALSAYVGAPVSLPPVFTVADAKQGRRAGRSAPPPVGRSAPPQRSTCPECGRLSARRVCPSCHNALPAAYCETSGKIIALVGAKNSGKSTYIAVLLHELAHRLGAELDTSLMACDDRTIERYKRDFDRPLFVQRRLLPTTASAVTGPRDPLVYLLTRSRPRRMLRNHEAAVTLVFFDTAGEDLRSREVTELHLRYLGAADAVVFLVDPLELPDPEVIEVLGRVTDVLRAAHDVPAGQRLPVPVAVALTKTDMLEVADSSPLRRDRPASGALDPDDRAAVHEQVRALLHQHGAADVDRFLAHTFTTFGLFGVSALGGAPLDGHVGPGGIRPFRVEDPLLWLLHRFGMVGVG